jgi:hypothetical protein
MATQAEGADVVQVALAAAFRHRQNVICVPETLAYPCRDSPVPHERQESGPARTLELAVFPEGVQPAVNAYPPIALQYLLPQISWLRAELPFVDAVIRAEGEAARRNLNRTPPA